MTTTMRAESMAARRLPTAAPVWPAPRTTMGLAAAWICAMALTACGGGGDDMPVERQSVAVQPAVAVVSPTGTARAAQVSIAAAGIGSPGTLQSVTRLGLITAQEVTQALVGSRLPPLAPAYAVETYRLTYTTIDGQGLPIVASGLLAVPKKAAGARSPVISYQHGTVFHDADAPSNHATADEPTVIMASLGFVVIAADYVGYGASKGALHPYLLSAPTAAAVVDLLRAGRTHVLQVGLPLNGQLFLVGYSEGGYASAAAHRALQQAGGDLAAALVGSVPGAGPLDVGATLDELLRRVRSENALLAFLVNPDLLQNLGASLRRRVRDELLKKLLPGDSDVVFQSTFIDNFLANDRAAINRDSDVHDWRPATPVRLFHGRDDQTVPFIASLSALQTMQARGAPNVMLTACPLAPAEHLTCVPPYWTHMLGQIGLVVRDL